MDITSKCEAQANLQSVAGVPRDEEKHCMYILLCAYSFQNEENIGNVRMHLLCCYTFARIVGAEIVHKHIQMHAHIFTRLHIYIYVYVRVYITQVLSRKF